MFFFNTAVYCYTPDYITSDPRFFFFFFNFHFIDTSSPPSCIFCTFHLAPCLRCTAASPRQRPDSHFLVSFQWKEVLLFTDMTQDRSHILWPITVHKKHTYSNRKTFCLCVSLDSKYVLVVVFVNTFNLFKAGNNRRLLIDEWVINIFRNRCSFVLRLRSSVNWCVCLCVCAFCAYFKIQ